MKVLLLSRYGRLGASSRVRCYQYLRALREWGIDVTPAPLLGDEYVADLYAGRRAPLLRILSAYSRRAWHVVRSSRFDLLWIEYELLPWLPAWAEAVLATFNIPYVVDYDDAIFHRYELHHNPLIRATLSNKIDEIMRQAALVTVGNEYLANRAHRAGARRIEFLPTVVDLSRYKYAGEPVNTIYTVGWIGSPITSPYLDLVRPALAEVCKHGGGQVILVGSRDVTFDGVRTLVRPWAEETEVAEIQHFDVGIMPLPDKPWERGKCGYKLIQYMGCGRPVVASPVGANKQIVEHGVNGFLAITTSEWIDALSMLRDASLRRRMGQAGRAKVERDYSLQVTAPRLAAMLHSLARGVR